MPDVSAQPIPSAAEIRTVLIPDVERELLAVLEQLEELLLMLAPSDDPDDELPDLPAPIRDGQALACVRRLWAALRPTQHTNNDMHWRGRLVGPGGRYEHMPLTPVDLDTGDLDVVAATAQALDARRRGSAIDEAVQDAAQFGPAITPAAIVESVARLHGTLDLGLTADARMLLPQLRASLVGDVVLTQEQEAAYQRTVDRINIMWSGSGIDRFLY